MKTIPRHKTAIGRTELSRPFQLALAAGIIRPGDTIFDYGCGRGDDVRALVALGFDCEGWDPVHRAHAAKRASDVVNLGYVVNVIESPEERASALGNAWSLARRTLIVAARVDIQECPQDVAQHADGVLTSRGTFQKFYTQSELRGWIEEVLGTSCIAAGPGIFFVFRSEGDRQRYSSALVRRRLTTRLGRLDEALFQSNRALLTPLIEFFEERGRLPDAAEVVSGREVVATFGSIPKAFRAVWSVLGDSVLQQIEEGRRDDLLVYLALEKFRRRPRFSALPSELRNDVKAFFGSYTRACEEADQLLFSAGDRGLLRKACECAPVGKLTSDGLYVHRSALEKLPPVLRVFEGCARVLVGEVDDANLIKLDRERPKVSYLSYPDFDRIAHPALVRSIVVWLDTMAAKLYDFSGRENPPILHRKEAFVAEDYPNRQRFARLTRQEERQGLLDDPAIGTKQGWEAALAERQLRVAGHVLRRS